MFGATLRIVMSSIMCQRNGLTSCSFLLTAALACNPK